MNQQFAEALLRLAEKNPDKVAYAIAGPFVTLNKMEAARRQLNVAAWLWFKGAEPASIHTLTGAAFGILADLFHHKTKTRPVPFNDAHLDEDLRGFTKVLRNLLKDTEYFLKHARKDPNETHPLNPIWTEHYMFNAIKAYTELNDGNCDQLLLSLFVIRFRILHPDIWDSSDPGFDERWDVEASKSISNVEFFERFGGPLRDWPPRGD